MSTNVAVSSPAVDPEAKRRVLYVLAVSIFPVALASLISLSVFSSGAIDTRNAVGNETKFASIVYPSSGEKVGDKFEASGLIKNVPDGSVVYIAEFADGRYWPKRKIGSSPGPWSRAQVADGKSGYKYTLVLLSVPPIGEKQIEDWFATGRSTGKYPGILSIEGFKALASTRIVKR